MQINEGGIIDSSRSWVLFLLACTLVAGCVPYGVYGPYSSSNSSVTTEDLVFATGGQEALEEYIKEQGGALGLRERPPSLLRETVPPRPSDYAVWIAGNWIWSNTSWQWRTGYWNFNPPSRRWIAGEWRARNGLWDWNPGYWDGSQALLEGLAVAATFEALTAPPRHRLKFSKRAPPSGQHIWLDGYWAHGNSGWSWVRGYWGLAPASHCRWQAVNWINRGDRWVSSRPRWSC